MAKQERSLNAWTPYWGLTQSKYIPRKAYMSASRRRSPIWSARVTPPESTCKFPQCAPRPPASASESHTPPSASAVGAARDAQLRTGKTGRQGPKSYQKLLCSDIVSDRRERGEIILPSHRTRPAAAPLAAGRGRGAADDVEGKVSCEEHDRPHRGGRAAAAEEGAHLHID